MTIETRLDWKSLNKSQRLKAIKPFIEQGLTSSQIASQFINATRNAVIGVLHRAHIRTKHLNMAERREVSKTRKWYGPGKGKKDSISAKRDYKASQNGPKSDRPMYRPSPARYKMVDETDPPPVEPLARTIPFMELKAGMCKWPQGDPKHSDFSFCGHSSLKNKPYCQWHNDRAQSARQWV